MYPVGVVDAVTDAVVVEGSLQGIKPVVGPDDVDGPGVEELVLMGMPDVVVGSTDVVEAEAEDEERSDSLKGNIPLFDGAVVVSAVAVTKDNLHE